MHREVVHRHIELDVLVECDELLGNAREFGIVDQGLAALVLLDLAGALEERFKVAIFPDQLRRGLDADTGHTRHVVGRVADQRLHLDDLFRRHAEFLHHLIAADTLVFHGVVHRHAVVHELHEVLIGRHDRTARAGLAGFTRISRDQVIGLEAGLLERGNVEGFHRIANEWELRNKIARHVRAVRLVFLVHLGAEGFFRLVEHDGEMRRLVLGLHVPQQLPQHVAESEYGIDLQSVGFAGQRRQRVIGAENIAGTIDQKDVVGLFQLAGRLAGFGRW